MHEGEDNGHLYLVKQCLTRHNSLQSLTVMLSENGQINCRNLKTHS